MSQIEIPILYEDSDIVVVNKPAGLVVNRSRTYAGFTLQDWMEERFHIPHEKNETIQKQAKENEYGTPEEIFRQRSGIVHRLDKDTSGVMVLAKSPDMLVELLRQFRERVTQKTYIALLHGKLIPEKGSVNVPTGRNETDRKKFTVSAVGKPSETLYELLEYFPNLPKGIGQKKGKSYQGFSLTKVMPKTGRTHQIRVHMASIHHPVVGDTVYAGKKRIAIDAQWCPRQFLHAAKLCFQHPRSKAEMCFEAPLSEDLQGVLFLLQNPT